MLSFLLQAPVCTCLALLGLASCIASSWEAEGLFGGGGPGPTAQQEESARLEACPQSGLLGFTGIRALIMNLIKGEQEPQSDLGFSL